MRALCVLALAACGGCAQLFGIDQTSAAKDAGADAAVDAPPGQVTMGWQRMSVGATVVRSPQDLSTSTAAFLIADGSAAGGFDHTAAMVTAPGTWAADIATGTPAAYFTLPDYPTPVPRLYDLGVRNQVGLYAVLEHPNPQPMPTGATLTFSFNLATPIAAGYSAQEYSLGTWTQYGFPVAVGQTSVGATVAGSAITSLNGRPVSAFTTGDAILALEYNGNTLIGAFIGSGVNQTGNVTFSGNMAGVAQNQTLSATVHPATISQRYAAIRPAMGNLGMAWYLNAAPASNIGNSGPQLNAVGVAVTDSGALSATYGNPFAQLGWDAVLTWYTVESRAFTPAGQALAATLYAQLYQFALPTAGVDLSVPAGLPITILLNGTPLVTDGTTVTIDPTKSVDISFQADQATCTLYQMQLFDLVPNAANTALQNNLVFGATGVAADFQMPPDPFVVGHNYALRGICLGGGFPTIASGDLTNRSLPLSVGYADGGVFTVAGPGSGIRP